MHALLGLLEAGSLGKMLSFNVCPRSLVGFCVRNYVNHLIPLVNFLPKIPSNMLIACSYVEEKEGVLFDLVIGNQWVFTFQNASSCPC